MGRILVGLATVKPDKRFLESVPSLFRSVSPHHLLTAMWVWDKPLVEAQNDFAERVLSEDYDYLLTIEDDNWGFTADMLEELLAMDTDVAAMSYRSRHFPFDMLPMKYVTTDKNGVRRFTGMRTISGHHEVDLCGFGFTLIKRHVLERLSKPVFRLNTQYYKGVGPHATDIDFCHRVQLAGMKIIGNFDHIINHRELTEETYKEMLVEGILAKHSMFTHIGRILTEKKRMQKEGVLV